MCSYADLPHSHSSSTKPHTFSHLSILIHPHPLHHLVTPSFHPTLPHLPPPLPTQDLDAAKAELKGLQEQLLAAHKGVKEAEAGG